VTSLIKYYRRTHRRHRQFPRFDEVAGRRKESEEVDEPRRREVVHLVVENYSGFATTNFGTEAATTREVNNSTDKTVTFVLTTAASS